MTEIEVSFGTLSALSFVENILKELFVDLRKFYSLLIVLLICVRFLFRETLGGFI